LNQRLLFPVQPFGSGSSLNVQISKGRKFDAQRIQHTCRTPHPEGRPRRPRSEPQATRPGAKRTGPNLAQYILRNPFSYATNRLWETFDGPAFIAAITRHIPPPGQHLVRYYGAYSNRARGERRKQAANATIPNAANTPLPIRRSNADFAKEQEYADNEQRAQTFTQVLPLDLHPDACLPPGQTRTIRRESGPGRGSPVSSIRFRPERLFCSGERKATRERIASLTTTTEITTKYLFTLRSRRS
jgi:hypothetical protein